MLNQALRWLGDAGIVAAWELPPSGRGAVPDAILVITGDGDNRFAVEVRQRSPYPNELPRLSQVRAAIEGFGVPLLVVPFVPGPVGRALTDAGWSWADAQGNFDIRAPRLLLRQRRTAAAPKPTARSLPQGSGGLAIIRSLIGFVEGEDEEPGATALAAQAKVTQPRVSQVLGRLLELGLVDRAHDGRWVPHRDALLDRFLAEYRGPGGSQQFFFSLAAPTEVALRAAGSRAHDRWVASADVGPDLLVSWRRPTTVVLYVEGRFDPAALGLVEAQGRHDANVIVREPADLSVFPVPALVADVRGTEVPLAHPTQQIWDLQDLGGADRLEAAGRLREWLLKRH
jgi:DNA-binding transcriptional ArsR family regulator